MLIHCPFHFINSLGRIAPNIPDLIHFKSFFWGNEAFIHFNRYLFIYFPYTTQIPPPPSRGRQGEVALLAAPARCRGRPVGGAALGAVLGDAVAVQAQRALAARAEEGHGQVVGDLGQDGKEQWKSNELVESVESPCFFSS